MASVYNAMYQTLLYDVRVSDCNAKSYAVPYNGIVSDYNAIQAI